jgi:hypothetical protein
LDAFLLGKAVDLRSAIQRTFDIEGLGRRTIVVPLVLVSVAIFKAFFTLGSMSFTAINTLGL